MRHEDLCTGFLYYRIRILSNCFKHSQGRFVAAEIKKMFTVTGQTNNILLKNRRHSNRGRCLTGCGFSWLASLKNIVKK